LKARSPDNIVGKEVGSLDPGSRFFLQNPEKYSEDFLKSPEKTLQILEKSGK